MFSSVSALLKALLTTFSLGFCCFSSADHSLSLSLKLKEHLCPHPQPQNNICIPKYLYARVSLSSYPELYHFSEHTTVCLKMEGKDLKTVFHVPWRCSVSVQTPGVGLGAETLRKGWVGGQGWPGRGLGI